MDYLDLAFWLFWAVCGVLEFGFTFAYFQKEYERSAAKEYEIDRMNSVIYALFGPISLGVSMFSGHFKHGLKFR